MTSKAITEKPDNQPPRGDWRPARELAPSVMRDDEPKIARMVGLWGLMISVLGTAIIVLTNAGFRGLFGSGWGILFLAGGVLMMLFHAVIDKDEQVRRAYGSIGGAGLFLVGAILPWIPYGDGTLFGLGYPCLCLSLGFQLIFLRQETDTQLRNFAIKAVGGAGVLLALIGMVGGSISVDFLVPRGLLLTLLALPYLCAFINVQGEDSELGFRAGWGIMGFGLLLILIGLGRSLFQTDPYLVPGGITFIGVGALYAFSALLLVSENKLVVMLRRELALYFFSPIAYLVLVGMAFCTWFSFFVFVISVAQASNPQSPSGVMEPIVRDYFNILPIFCMVFIVPVITMRLFSEEKRTGTLEVALTAPVKESVIVLSKFFAGLIFFLVTWVPWALMLVALRVMSGKEFDYRPLISFYLVMAVLGAGFIGMGLFFSSLTRNQIASAVLTFAGMLTATIIYLLKVYVPRILENSGPDHPLVVILRHLSYIDTWFEALDGKLVPKYLLFHLSAAVLYIFLTIKVLEARKWS